MASAKFLEEALSTDVDESAVSALVGSLENQLVTSAPPPVHQAAAGAPLHAQNHVNSAIPNGGTVPSQKHGANIANGDTINTITGTAAQVAASALHNTQTVTNYTTLTSAADSGKPNEQVNIVYTQGNHQAMTTSGAIIPNRVTFPQQQQQQNGTIGLPQTVLQTATSNVGKQPTTLVIKTSGGQGGNAGHQQQQQGGLVTVPMNAVQQQVNNVGSPSAANMINTSTHQQQQQHQHNPTNILSNLQVVNVRQQPGMQAQQAQKGGQQPARVVLSAPQLVGARPGTPQITLQSLQGLQPGQQGHLLLKTENGQYQLLRVGPAPAGGAGLANATAGGQPVTFRMQAVPAQAATTTPVSSATTGVSQQVTVPTPTVVTTTPIQKPANDNTKEKCRKFLANLLELSSREPKSVEKNVRSLIQDLIDMRVEPEDFCDRLERLLNASPQPCLIGFLKKSLPLLRHSLATKELTIDGIRPPPVTTILTSSTPTVQTQVRPGLATSQVRLVTPTTTVVRPGLVQQRVVTPLRGAVQQTRMVTTIRQPVNANQQQQQQQQQVIVSSSQPPALHPVYPANQVRTGINIVRQPMQVRAPAGGQIRQPMTIRTAAAPVAAGKNIIANLKTHHHHQQQQQQQGKPTVPSNIAKLAMAKDKEKKTFSSAYTGDDDINDVAAMGGVNLAEETQRILGSTEFVGTQIRSCKEEYFLSAGALQQRIRQAMCRHGLEEASADVAAVISHAAQERLKNLVEKLAIITEHRLEMVKSDTRYEVTSDIKGQLKFLEELDRAERKRHEEMEREMLMRAAKSRSKTEDPEQAKLKAKAKEMQRVEMEEQRQREANATALQAIGPRKKLKLDGDVSAGASQSNSGGLSTGARGQLPLKQRMKKVTLRDLQFLFETEKDLCKSTLLYKSYLK